LILSLLISFSNPLKITSEKPHFISKMKVQILLVLSLVAFATPRTEYGDLRHFSCGGKPCWFEQDCGGIPCWLAGLNGQGQGNGGAGASGNGNSNGQASFSGRVMRHFDCGGKPCWFEQDCGGIPCWLAALNGQGGWGGQGQGNGDGSGNGQGSASWN
jgi:hypothetical protein